jgi:hypothetical protein
MREENEQSNLGDNHTRILQSIKTPREKKDIFPDIKRERTGLSQEYLQQDFGRDGYCGINLLSLLH